MSATATNDVKVRGLLVESKPEMIVLALPGTDYRLHLAVGKPVDAPLNKPLSGRIYARAKRVDVVPSGGRFIEPVYGRPRRLQGRITQTDPQANTILVQCGAPFTCELTAGQRAENFHANQLVSFDVERGARIEVVELASHGKNSQLNPADTTPVGHQPVEGPQGPVEKQSPGKTKDHGALTADRDIEGQLKPVGEQPLNGNNG